MTAKRKRSLNDEETVNKPLDANNVHTEFWTKLYNTTINSLYTTNTINVDSEQDSH